MAVRLGLGICAVRYRRRQSLVKSGTDHVRQKMMTSGSQALVEDWRRQALVTAIGHRQALVSSVIGGSQLNSDDVRYL